MDEPIQEEQPIQPELVQPSKYQFSSILILSVIVVGLAGYTVSAKFFNLWPFQAPQVVIPTFTLRPSPSTSSGQSAVPADWKTYRNDEYGFEFKYPRDFNIEIINNQQNGLKYDVIFIEAPLGDGFYNNFVITVSKNITLDEWLRKMEPKDPSGGSLVTKKSDITFLAIPTKEWEVFVFDHVSMEIIFEKDNMVYSLSWESEDPNLPNFDYYKKISDQILSTFKFIDIEGKFCGGIAAIACPEGYTCQLDGSYPDAGGKCVKVN